MGAAIIVVARTGAAAVAIIAIIAIMTGTIGAATAGIAMAMIIRNGAQCWAMTAVIRRIAATIAIGAGARAGTGMYLPAGPIAENHSGAT